MKAALTRLRGDLAFSRASNSPKGEAIVMTTQAAAAEAVRALEILTGEPNRLSTVLSEALTALVAAGDYDGELYTRLKHARDSARNLEPSASVPSVG